MAVSRPLGRQPPSPTAQPGRTRRDDLEGLRGIAALLVAVYHIWFDRISGGVDVFFVVSGYLMTRTIVRQVTVGSFSYRAHLLRIARRILPAAMLVLATVVVVAPRVLSPVTWISVDGDIRASLLYVANWHFAHAHIDYNAVDSSASPVLHMWAMSVQGQFYVVWPLIVGALVWLAARIIPSRPPLGVVVGLIIVSVTSFWFALRGVDSAQPYAYFDTRARLWEFSVGGLLALVPATWDLGPRVRSVLGGLGLLGILGGGLLLDIGRGAPGPVVLVPVLSAMGVIAAGFTSSDGAKLPISARLLGWRPLVLFGGVSYAFYLWHWPLLVFTRAELGRVDLGVTAGVGIVLCSLALAVVTSRGLERPFEAVRASRSGSSALVRLDALLPMFILVIVVALPLTLGGAGTPADAGQPVGDHPGALVFTAAVEAAESYDADPIPPLVEARSDRAANAGCSQRARSPQPDELLTCQFGNQDAEHDLVLVGASHARHWRAGLELVAAEMDLRFTTLIRDGCRFSVPPLDDASEECSRWNQLVLRYLIEERPHAIFTTASITRADEEYVPSGYVSAWSKLDQAGVNVIAVRDTPNFPFDPLECVATHGPSSDECSVAWRDVFSDQEIDELTGVVPDSTYLIDLTDYFCSEERCPAVVGNVLVYRDDNHISDTYARTLAPILVDAFEVSGLFGPLE
ncbi:MAG: acyltransferase [Ilumatobacter sp.]|nr:MAG: acyltransferase [Ilumatobacter sp.]